MNSRHGNLRTIKEIAGDIGRSRTFVQAAKAEMENRGIRWNLNMMSTENFLLWVQANDFKCTSYAAKKRPKSLN